VTFVTFAGVVVCAPRPSPRLSPVVKLQQWEQSSPTPQFPDLNRNLLSRHSVPHLFVWVVLQWWCGDYNAKFSIAGRVVLLQVQ
jgi:hypothetical protein